MEANESKAPASHTAHIALDVLTIFIFHCIYKQKWPGVRKDCPA